MHWTLRNTLLLCLFMILFTLPFLLIVKDLWSIVVLTMLPCNGIRQMWCVLKVLFTLAFYLRLKILSVDIYYLAHLSRHWCCTSLNLYYGLAIDTLFASDLVRKYVINKKVYAFYQARQGGWKRYKNRKSNKESGSNLAGNLQSGSQNSIQIYDI